MSEGERENQLSAQIDNNSSQQLHQRFHSNHGTLVQLSENRLSAFRLRPSHEFNQGLVFSNQPLKDDQLFEVRIDRKVHSWTGSLQIGVMTSDPALLQPAPHNALDVVNKSWVLSGCNLFENGKIIIEDYGPDLDELNETDRVGVMRTSEGDLVFYVNSFAQGVAATGLPSSVYAMVDLYGKCVQATVMNRTEPTSLPRPLLTLNSVSTTGVDSNQEEEQVSVASTPSSAAALDRLRFHHRCGTMVKLSSAQRTAERRHPLDEFNNGVVMTQRALLPDELFEISIDSLVDKWSGSIEMGITTHNPTALDFPSTMTNLRSGTIMMSGCGILTNGKGTRREYGQCNLDELMEGDRIALMICRSSGDLHFYVNGRDQGIAAPNVQQPVWGVVDLYGRTVKVSLIDREDVQTNWTEQENREPCDDDITPLALTDQLQFNTRCGLHAAVVNGGVTAHRPNAQSDFNHGVVLTNRPLRPDELFEVVLERVVLKWAGSIEIGVTTQRPDELDFPATMTNVRSGTWMMTGNGVMHNGQTVLDDYGTSLDRLGTGDRVGVVRRANGVVHFYVNGEDQGPAAGHVPEDIYGVVDLYGQAAQVSIVDHSPVTPLTTDGSLSPSASYLYATGAAAAALGSQLTLAPLVSPTSLTDSTSSFSNASATTLIHTDLTFHRLHGRNTILNNGHLTASRPNALSEFNDAICMTNRPLKAGEMFEVVIEKLVERWSGSLEMGVTAIRPEQLDFPSTMTDIDYETWMLSGSSVMQDGTITRNGYPLDLDALQENCRVGLLRHDDASLHYYLDGRDQGVACRNVPSDVYAVIDLYGQCAQVSIVHRPLQPAGLPANTPTRPQDLAVGNSVVVDEVPEDGHHFEQHHWSVTGRCGKAVSLSDAGRMARRDVKDFQHGLVFSSTPLLPEEPFEIRIEAVAPQWAGSLAVGLTTYQPPKEGVCELPSRLDLLDAPSWFVTETKVMQQPEGIVHHRLTDYNLESLAVGDTVQLLRKADSTVHVSVNGRDLGVCLYRIPMDACVVADLHGMIQSVSVTSSGRIQPECLTPVATTLPLSLSQLALREAVQGIQSALSSRFGDAFTQQQQQQQQTGQQQHQQRFHEHHGRNVVLINGQTAQRTASYNQGLVYSKDSLAVGQCFQVKIDTLDERWTGSLMIGLTGISPDKTPSSPTSALLLKQSTWIVSGKSIYQSGSPKRKIESIMEEGADATLKSLDLNQLRVGQSVGVYLSPSGHLGLALDGRDLGPLVWIGLTEPLYAVLDLYGACTQVTIASSGRLSTPSPPSQQATVEEKALRESSRSEKTPATPSPVNGDCRYRSDCTKFIRLLGLPDAYLEPNGPSFCGCRQCINDETKTDPFMKDWCSWTLRSRRKQQQKPDANEKWQTAYHVTRPAVVRRILDEGQLLAPDLNVWQRAKTARRSNDKGQRDGESDGQLLLFSPSLQTASTSAPVSQLFDPVLKTMKHGQVVLQVSLQPGSYKVRRASSPLNGPLPSSTNTSAGDDGISPAVTCSEVTSEPSAQLLSPPAAVTISEDSSAIISEDCPSVIFYQTKERGAALVQRLLIRLTDEVY